MHRVISTVCAIAALAAPALAQLSPPPGPIEPTMKTLDEIEPSIPIGPETTPGGGNVTYIINKPGRYHLTGPIVAEPGMQGIAVGQGHISIDMRGFTIICAPDEPGVRVNGSGRVKIRNGFFQGANGSTVLDFQSGYGHVIENIHVQYGQRAIRAAAGSLVKNCFVYRPGGTGIWGGTGTIIEGCRVLGLSTATTYGIVGNEGSLIKDCTVNKASIYGIYSISGRVVDSTVTGAVGAGFYAVDGAALTGCVATNNAGHGFIGTSAIRFTGCTAESNGLDGFSVFEFCHLRDNIASRNGQLDDYAAGIRTTGRFNRIDGNTCADNSRYGTWVDTKFNVVINNLGASNGLWNIAVPEHENFNGGSTVTGHNQQRVNGNFNAP